MSGVFSVPPIAWTKPSIRQGRLALPVICAPMFTVSVPDLVIVHCKAGIVGGFPALNARPAETLERNGVALYKSGKLSSLSNRTVLDWRMPNR